MHLLICSHLLLPVASHTRELRRQDKRREVSRTEDRSCSCNCNWNKLPRTLRRTSGPERNNSTDWYSSVTFSSGTAGSFLSCFQLLRATQHTLFFTFRETTTTSSLLCAYTLQRRSHSHPTSQPRATLETWAPPPQKRAHPSRPEAAKTVRKGEKKT